MKGTALGGQCRVLTPSLRVTNSWIQKIGFSQTCFIFVFFNSFPEITMVATPNLFFYKLVYFLVHHPVVISVATNCIMQLHFNKNK